MEIFNSENPNLQKNIEMLLDSNTMHYRPCSPMAIQFQKEYFEEFIFTDRSLVISSNDTPLLGAVLSEHKNQRGLKEISGYGYPGILLENKALTENELKKARKIFVKNIMSFKHPAENIQLTFIDLMAGNKINYLTNYMLDNGAKATQVFTRIIDLQQDINMIFSNVRKSYKSLINWGQNNLTYKILENSNFEKNDFTEFKSLHKNVSGRTTRNDMTWDIQYDRIKNNEAFLVLGYMEKELITSGFFPFTSNYCWYGVGASKREFFDKPVSHGLIWKAINYAKEIGCKYFEMGLQNFPDVGKSTPTQKELGISEFKRSFGGFTTSRTLTSIDTEKL